MKFFDSNKMWKMIKVSGILLIIEIIILVIAIVTHKPEKKSRYVSTDRKNAEVVVTNKTVEKKLESIAELGTYEYEYKGEVTREADKNWVILNALTKSEITIEYEGVIKAGIIVDDIVIEVNQKDKVIFLTMPDPTILSNEINVTDYDEDVAVFGSVSGSDGTDMLEMVKEEELEEAIDDGLLDEAYANSKKAIKDLLSVYEDYEIVFVETKLNSER